MHWGRRLDRGNEGNFFVCRYVRDDDVEMDSTADLRVLLDSESGLAGAEEYRTVLGSIAGAGAGSPRETQLRALELADVWCWGLPQASDKAGVVQRFEYVTGGEFPQPDLRWMSTPPVATGDPGGL